MGISIEVFKVHTFFNMTTTPQVFFFYITLKSTLCYEKWYQFHFSTMIWVGISSVAFFFLSTTVHIVVQMQFSNTLDPLLFLPQCNIKYWALKNTYMLKWSSRIPAFPIQNPIKQKWVQGPMCIRTPAFYIDMKVKQFRCIRMD